VLECSGCMSRCMRRYVMVVHLLVPQHHACCYSCACLPFSGRVSFLGLLAYDPLHPVSYWLRGQMLQGNVDCPCLSPHPALHSNSA
jgi:hypothetical protein